MNTMSSIMDRAKKIMSKLQETDYDLFDGDKLD